MIAGLLHDVLEDTGVTADEMRGLGVPDEVIAAVESVSRQPGERYEEAIDRARANPLGAEVKLGDNAQNTEDLESLEDDAERDRLRMKYRVAKAALLGQVS